MFDIGTIRQIIDLGVLASILRRLLPQDHEHLRTIMERVFLAGLKREEDRPIRVSVCYLDPEAIVSRGHSGEDVVFHLAVPIPLTVDALVKMAPAFDPTTTALAVFPQAGRSDRLMIWGGIFSSIRGRNRFDALPEGLLPPEVLTVTTRKPGGLSVIIGRRIITRFSGGRFSVPTPTPFTSSLMGWSLLKVVKHHPEQTAHGMHYWNTYRDMVDRLLVEANLRGHGGTVIWIPEERLDNARQLIRPNNRLTRFQEGSPLVGELCAIERHRETVTGPDRRLESNPNPIVVEETILECKRKIVEHVELLAQMTRVDGALILSDRLRPLSFGSFLEAPPWPGDTVLGTDDGSEDARSLNLSHYGTRHNSAVNFIGRCPGCVGFVLSQDGPIAGLTQKDDRTVYWWPDCLSQLWAV